MAKIMYCVVVLSLWLSLVSGPWVAGDVEADQFDSNVAPRTVRGEVVQSERDEQEALFNYYFRQRNLEYETRLSELPREASVPSWRTPYSAAIHPQASGGLSSAGSARPIALFRARRTGTQPGGSSVLVNYDRAFNGGSNWADSWEARRLMGDGDRPGTLARSTAAEQLGILGGVLQRIHSFDDQASGTGATGGRWIGRRDSRRGPATLGYQGAAELHLQPDDSR